MADEEGKATPAPEDGEPAPAADQEAESAQGPESLPSTEQPADPPTAEEGDNAEMKGELKTDDAPEQTVADGASGEAQPETEKKEGELDATATDAPDQEGAGDAEAPDQEVPGDAEAPVQEPAGDAGQPEEQKPETDEAEAAAQEPQTDGEEQPKFQEEEAGGEIPLPKSEDFTAGEEPEAPINVMAEELSREGTPTEPPDDGIETSELVHPGTPEKEGDDKGVILEEEEEEEIPKPSREELVEKYTAALQEREMLNQKNHALQHKLAEYFRRKKTEDSRQEVDRNVTDQEQRYMKYMSNLEELRQQETGERESYNEQIEEMKDRRAVKQTLVEEEWKVYCDFKRSVALASVNSRSGRPLTLKEFEVYEINEVRKEAEVSQVRLENIKLKNRLRKRELQLKQKEELAEGLHLIDFEQLKIENQTYNEKIEERNEELMKLRKKITSTVQVLTHLKEKLQFVQGENQVAKQELAHIEAEVAGKRDILSRTKQARDALRHDNSKLQQKCGLLGNRLLLRDYEEGVDEIGDLGHRLDQLKRTHAELTLSISGVKKKIEQARAQQQS